MVRIGGLLLALLIVSLPFASRAQQNPLIGVWRSSQAASPQGPANTVTLAFGADGTYQFEQAFASTGPGVASGVVSAAGEYRVTAQNQVFYRIHFAQLCAGGTCQPRPDLVGSGTLTFSFQGNNQLVLGGTVYLRIG